MSKLALSVVLAICLIGCIFLSMTQSALLELMLYATPAFILFFIIIIFVSWYKKMRQESHPQTPVAWGILARVSYTAGRLPDGRIDRSDSAGQTIIRFRDQEKAWVIPGHLSVDYPLNTKVALFETREGCWMEKVGWLGPSWVGSE